MFHWHWKFFWFCSNHIPPCTKIESCVNDPVDLIFERYSQECLKEGTRNNRGSGSIFVFEGDHTPIANNMEQRFIKESKNKDKLNEYSAKKLISLHEGSQLMVATSKDTGLSSFNAEPLAQSDTNIIKGQSEEADQRIIRYVLPSCHGKLCSMQKDCNQNHRQWCTCPIDILCRAFTKFGSRSGNLPIPYK